MKQVYVSSKSNKTVMFAASLQEKKYREQHGAFFVEGWKLLEEAAKNRLPITHIFLLEDRAESFIERLEASGFAQMYPNCELIVVSLPCFEKISTEKSPQGVITVIKHLDFFKRCIKINKEDISDTETVLFLDSVRDPGNLGAIIRSAVAFGTELLLLSDDCADLYNPRTVRAAMGNLFCVRTIRVNDVTGSIAALRSLGRRVLAAELTERAIPLHEAAVTSHDVFVIGNEGHGIEAEVSAACDASVYIPMRSTVESLNAAVAASVLLWEQSKKI